MRQSLILLAVVLIALCGYTAYGLATFEADKPYEFSFAEPKLPPDIVGMSKQKEADPTLTPEMAKQTEAAVSQMSQAVAMYQNYEKTAPQQAVSTFSIINSAILNGKLPAYLLSSTKNTLNVRNFEMITLRPTQSSIIDDKTKGKSVTCRLGDSGYADIVIGDAGDNDVKCDAPRDAGQLDRMFLGGPGNDMITSSAGNVIVNAGSGNDVLTLGEGRVLLVLEDGWGNDTLTYACTNAAISPAEVPKDFPVPWVNKNTNFIILSPRINPSDVVWEGNVLTNKTTGDTLSVTQNCFNVVGSSAAASEEATATPAAPATP
jgi:hypothetical protein